MGAADIVPGVSGGTIALLLGIYDRLIEELKAISTALSKLGRGDFRGLRRRISGVNWSFLTRLLVGIILAHVLLVSWLRDQITEHHAIVSSVFSGPPNASPLLTRRENRT